MATPRASNTSAVPHSDDDAAGAVLAHRHAGAGGDEGGHRRHVDRVRAITAGADDVDGAVAQLVAERHQLGGGEHGVEQPGQLVGRLPLRPQGDDEADQLGGGGLPGEDRGHGRARLLGGEITPGEQLGEQPRPTAVVGERIRVGVMMPLGHGRLTWTVPGLRRCGGAGG